MDNNGNFYTETIRGEVHEQKKVNRKLIIASCIISIICGFAIGLGIGVGIPLASEIIIPRLAINNVSVTTSVETTASAEIPHDASGFKFDDAKETTSVSTVTNVALAGIGDIIDAVEPSVVCITSVFRSTNPYMLDMEATSAGSGIIFHETGERVYIVTNYHVLEGATSVNASISGSEDVTAFLVGRDADADLAVLYVLKEDLSAVGVDNVAVAVFGDSSLLRKGDFVLAIGNPFGDGKASTLGIVGAKDREIIVSDKALNVIQTDVSLSSGYSGGPLVNTNGEVIGINTAKSSSGGVSYSISVNDTKPIIEALMNQKPRPFLGIEGQDITDEISEKYNVPKLGVLVRSVIPNSSAEKAGIVSEDIITSFDKHPVLTMEQLSEIISGREVGDTIELKILRGGNPISITVTLMDYSLVGF